MSETKERERSPRITNIKRTYDISQSDVLSSVCHIRPPLGHLRPLSWKIEATPPFLVAYSSDETK